MNNTLGEPVITGENCSGEDQCVSAGLNGETLA